MQLKQRRSPLRTTYFDLGDHLKIRERSLFRTVEAEFDLRRISPTPLRLQEIPVRWLIAAATFSIVSFFALLDGWLTREAGTAFGLLLVVGCALACWLNAWQLYRNVLVYRDRVTSQTAFVMLHSSPSANAVADFCAQIAAKAEAPLPPLGASKSEVIAHNSRVLHYLLEAGVLLPEEHRVALARLEQSFAKGSVVSLVRHES